MICAAVWHALRRNSHAMLAKAALRREMLKVNSNRPAPDASDEGQLAFAGF